MRAAFILSLFLSWRCISSPAHGAEPDQIIFTAARAFDLDVAESPPLLAVLTDLGVRIYDLENKKWTFGPVECGKPVRFTRDGDFLLAFGFGNRGGTAWDVANSYALLAWDTRLYNAYWDFNGARYARVIVTDYKKDGADRVEIGEWLHQKPATTFTIPQQLHRDAALSHDGKLVAVMSGQGGVEDIVTNVHDLETGQTMRSFGERRQHSPSYPTFEPERVRFCMSDKCVVLSGKMAGQENQIGSDTESYRSGLFSYDLATGTEQWNHRSKWLRNDGLYTSSDGRLVAVAVSAEGGRKGLVDSAGREHQHGIRLFEAVTGREVARLVGVDGPIIRVVVSTKRRAVYAVTERAPRVYVWKYPPASDR